MLSVSCRFDSGAIEVIDASDAAAIRLRLRADSHADIRQWFHFRLVGAAGQPCALRIENAGEATYPSGWAGYRACASYDREHWFRIATEYDGKTLTLRVTPQRESMYFAYFEPYSWERHLALLARCEASGLARIERLGSTVDGRDLDLVIVGEPRARARPVWVIARQHPGETMAEWFVDGLLERLLDRSDPVARLARERAVFYLVPNMNPDGSVRGNLRTNAAGVNLNREWQQPSPERSPEVWWVRQRMLQTGAHLVLDVHGDETLPYVFIEGPQQLPGFTPAQGARLQAFLDGFVAASPDFQTEHGYPKTKETKANPRLASKWASEQFGGLAMTLELPFKDNANLPDPIHGWSAARSRRLGAAILHPMLADLSSPAAA
ncbi:MAG TPA: M14-type cytosolic carboxypeptidase [Burkholderiaceae bacterium]|nr:M14-type cytosolic carboxypeptidase [Burkholderiaceae bacterium]